ncbi:MAG: NUDIX domain-containing protein [Gammaproteobacteria bacterium]
MNPIFCSMCSSRLERRQVDGRERDVCPHCSFVHYRQLIVGAGALIDQGGSLLLVRRATSPFLGCWGFPAGHVEADESPADAAVRETLEETGLHVSVVRLIDAYFFNDHPKGNGIFLVYACEISEGVVMPTIEVSEVTFFRRDTLPRDLAGGGHRTAILAWKG